MTEGTISYRTGFKYQLAENHRHKLRVVTPGGVRSELFSIDNGWLVISAGYAWDGASGPTRDTKNSMRGSLIHDALYQGIREKVLPESFRPLADSEFWLIVNEDGMRWWRAWAWFGAVRRFGGEAASKVREVLTAP
jgi:hypothetical protein